MYVIDCYDVERLIVTFGAILYSYKQELYKLICLREKFVPRSGFELHTSSFMCWQSITELPLLHNTEQSQIFLSFLYLLQDLWKGEYSQYIYVEVHQYVVIFVSGIFVPNTVKPA